MVLFCYLCFVFVMPSCLFIAALWSPAGKGLSSWLSFVFVTFQCGALGQVWYLKASILDLCLLTCFYSNYISRKITNIKEIHDTRIAF